MKLTRLRTASFATITLWTGSALFFADNPNDRPIALVFLAVAGLGFLIFLAEHPARSKYRGPLFALLVFPATPIAFFFLIAIGALLQGPPYKPALLLALLQFTAFFWSLLELILLPYDGPRDKHLPNLCPTCHYDLRATPNRCPECGYIPQSLTSPNQISNPHNMS